ncbi:MBOAT family O-acyltransferase [Aquimarina mytili]|uniref:MBOAT family protein n=1 Tax=Aquimarina mytili TaxID=874423 RepID=A0A937A191_9FLAO|nr:MBOAT family protein [Aquimarina mytili]MBL0683165.1 MBOAT family protein [Aquimarina mytili]
MLFNSLEYIIFLPVVFFIYWAVFNKKLQTQNWFLLIASYFFYGFWDWRFLFLILASTIVDFFVGQRIHSSSTARNKKSWLWLSILFNVGLLGFFKYFNFFIDSWIDLASIFGYTIHSTWTLKIILPVGISFYTFQTMSYSFDIYHKKITPTRDFISFATFVSFFPQLVAGPIERASNLLPQILNKRTFNYLQAVEGLKLILWGFFKKLVIADALAPLVDDIFANYSQYSPSTLIMGVFFFSFQIYGDFSGYSDIAIGTAKLFGIELSPNFKFPYFSRNIAEFWRRWHISLSRWFRDYLYIPLGGSKVNRWISIRNVFIIFLVSGFWHGANWTFIIWGGIHALLFLPLLLTNNNRTYLSSTIAEKTILPSLKELFQILTTFILVTFSWIFFRASSLTHAWAYLKAIFSNDIVLKYAHPSGYRMIDYFIIIILFVMYEYCIRKDERVPFDFKSRYFRFLIYAILLLAILLFYDDQIDRSFIYFQF